MDLEDKAKSNLARLRRVIASIDIKDPLDVRAEKLTRIARNDEGLRQAMAAFWLRNFKIDADEASF